MTPWSSLDRREWQLLGLLGTAGFFNRYDEGLLSLLLVQIQADLGFAEASLGWLGSAIELGAIPSLALLVLADRWGRRPILLGTILGYTVCTVATALAPSAGFFLASQLLARMFLGAEFGLAIVVAVEELRPTNRAFGVAILGTLSLAGHGAAMILFGFVDELPFGWRALYAIGVVPLLAVAALRRGLPETRAFRAVQPDSTDGTGSWSQPFRTLISRYPARCAAVGAVTLLWSFSNVSVDFFLPKFAQEVHGWSPGRFALVAVVGGALGLTGQLLAGWLGDRRGRKGSTLFFFVMEPVCAILLYSICAGGFIAMYVLWVFGSVANDVLARTYAGELFPTSARATALGAVGVLATLGSAAGLASESLLFGRLGTHWDAIRILASAGLLMPFIVWWAYPETRGRTLAEIAPETTAAQPGRAAAHSSASSA